MQWEDLTKKSVDALFALFSQPGGPVNLWEREQAVRVLAMKPAPQIESASREFLRGQPSPERYAQLNFLRSGYYGLHLDAYTQPKEPITAAAGARIHHHALSWRAHRPDPHPPALTSCHRRSRLPR